MLIAEGEFLLEGVDSINVIKIEDEPFPYTRKSARSVLESEDKQFFHSAQAHTDHIHKPIGGNHLRIIRIRFKINNGGKVNPQKFVAGVKVDDSFLGIHGAVGLDW